MDNKEKERLWNEWGYEFGKDGDRWVTHPDYNYLIGKAWSIDSMYELCLSHRNSIIKYGKEITKKLFQ